MAIFGKKKEEKKDTAAAPATLVVGGASRDLSRIILRPVITEKAAVLGDKNVYAFEVARSADKAAVSAAVALLWNVRPVKVCIVNRPPRRFVLRAKNREGLHAGMKKAYVYLKQGDRIELV